jgi:hypothetical protein
MDNEMIGVMGFAALIVGGIASLVYRIKTRREREKIMGRR